MSPTAATTAPPSSAGAPSAASVPFLAGSWEYTEPMFTDTWTLGASQSNEFIHNITPGGFLRGITLSVTASGGVLGTVATLNPDAPFAIFASMSIESIDGTPILYPMTGYSYYLVTRFTRPWDGDPAEDPAYSNSINPAFRLRFFNESRMSIGSLPNTDARAQYRIRYTIAPLVQASGSPVGLVSSSTGVTAPTLTINGYLETYAQPPQHDYAGNPIAQVPDGLALQRFVSHQNGDPLNTGDQTIKENRVGNLIRTLILVVRNSSQARVDLTADPVRLRLDNTQIFSQYRDRLDYEANRFWKQDSAMMSSASRPTGVYAYQRWHNPGAMDGPYWMPTTEASYLQFELNGGPSAGTLETITEDLAPAGAVPAYLQGL